MTQLELAVLDLDRLLRKRGEDLDENLYSDLVALRGRLVAIQASAAPLPPKPEPRYLCLCDHDQIRHRVGSYAGIGPCLDCECQEYARHFPVEPPAPPPSATEAEPGPGVPAVLEAYVLAAAASLPGGEANEPLCGLCRLRLRAEAAESRASALAAELETVRVALRRLADDFEQSAVGYDKPPHTYVQGRADATRICAERIRALAAPEPTR